MINNIIRLACRLSQCKYDGYPPGYNKVFEYIYPPIEWMEDGMKWRRVASTEPADRNQVIALAQDLKFNLSYWHARMHGVCLVRRELYAQCFSKSLSHDITPYN